jgi:nucleoside-diphosphate-sugar epimerase
MCILKLMQFLHLIIIWTIIFITISTQMCMIQCKTGTPNSKILVLGSGGLIGSRLTTWLKNNNYDVVQVTNRRHIDLRNRGCLDVFTDIDFVFFLACEVGGSKYINSNSSNVQLEIIENNILIYQTVFTWLRQMKIPFVFTSSYLQGQPTSYGTIKKLGEDWITLLGFGKIARLWNIYGYENVGPKSHVIVDWINNCLNYGKINSLTDGTEPRQFLHVDDTVRALGLMMINYKSIEYVTDLSSGMWITMKDMANVIISIYNTTSGLYGDTYISKCELCTVSFSKSQATMTEIINPKVTWFHSIWSPSISLKNGIEDLYVKYSKDNK